MSRLEKKLLELGYIKINKLDYEKSVEYPRVRICISLPSSWFSKNNIENAYIRTDRYIIGNENDIEKLKEVFNTMEKDLEELKNYV